MKSEKSVVKIPFVRLSVHSLRSTTHFLRANHPTYESPTRDRLSTPLAKRAVRKCGADAFRTFLEQERPFLDRLLAALAEIEDRP
ncbi:hypothetical protein [Chthoniobacter flavus]|uniref:hypothetical protein n=1 Tax=Chthoniobacter flavus TaxID=191863 RepID=UPI0005B2814D|nr:hypothetical protein [Chthoniobacter flavus]